jgi:soluble lytic murein transglycosylase-like protein
MSTPGSRALAFVWLASLLVIGAPCARPPAAEPEWPQQADERAPRDREVEAVRTRLAPHARDLGPEAIDALASAVVQASRAQALQPTLVLAVMEVESRFDPYAVSGKGAVGLMQLLPSTGAEVAHRVGIPWRGARTLFDPQANVQLGAAYLRELLDRYASVRVALAAYNEGPGQIEARLREGASLPVRYPERVLGAYWERATD